MALAWAFVFAALCCDRVDGLVFPTHRQADDGIVCISVAVYEDEPWIDALLKNAMFFMEPTTRVVLHLHAHTNYTDRQIAKWETDRVTVSPTRVAVEPFRGSLMYAHMMAAKHLDDRWPVGGKKKPCAYWVYQASNMFWVRRGLEEKVRKDRYGYIIEYDQPRLCSGGIPLFQHVAAKAHRYAWGRAESAFYPMETVRGFLREADKYLASVGGDSSLITDALCFLEEVVLQTYALNYDGITHEELKKHHGVRYTYSIYNRNGHPEQDSVKLSVVKQINQEREKWLQYYAVKRVNRDPNHKVTKYIMSLAE